jgi:hypothetical protein
VVHDGRVTPSADGAGTPPPSALRAAVATGEIVSFGALAHVGAGGMLPSAGHLIALALVVGAASAALQRRLLRLPTAALVAGLGQVGLHTLAMGAEHGAHAHHAGASTAATEADLGMLGAHLLSAAATVLVLLWQEQVLDAVVRLVSPIRRAVVQRPPQALVARRSPRPPAALLLGVAPRRGPPPRPASARS